MYNCGKLWDQGALQCTFCLVIPIHRIPLLQEQGFIIGRAAEGMQSWSATDPDEEPHMYRMAFPAAGIPRNFQVEGCPGRSATRTAMRVHFLHRHVWDTVAILDEGNPPHPRCPRCDILVPWRSLNGRHLATAQCAKGAEQKRRRLAEEELQESSEWAFQAYGEPLNNVMAFKYPGKVMTAGDDDWSSVTGNLQKARKSWVRMSIILSREGANPKVSGHFFKAVVQEVLLFRDRDRDPDPPGWSGSWSDFSTGSRDGSPGGIWGVRGRGFKNILLWRRQCKNQDSRRLGYKSRGGRIRLRNILRRDRIWTSLNCVFGGRERGCLSGDGSRKTCT